MDPYAGASEVAARMREQSARLTAAADAAGAVSYEAKYAVGQHSEVTVTASGLGQVTRISVGPRAMGSGPAELAATLTRLLNQAVRGARERANEAMLQAVDPGLRETMSEAASEHTAATDRYAAQLAREEVSASSPDQKVAVTASGAGEILALHFDPTALRGFDNVRLGEQITAAANGALEGARRLQQRLLDSLTDDEQSMAAALDARLTGFNRRMDELSDQLDQAGRRITGLE